MATSTRIAKRYAKALMNQALADKSLESIHADFTTIITALHASDELMSLIISPVIRHTSKVAILKEIFEGKISQLMMNFLVMITEKKRESVLPEISASFTELYNAEKNLVPVEFTSSVELDEALKAKLIDVIAKRTGKTVLSSFNVNADSKGGITIRIADTMIDASLRHQLDKLYHELSGSGTSVFA